MTETFLKVIGATAVVILVCGLIVLAAYAKHEARKRAVREVLEEIKYERANP